MPWDKKYDETQVLERAARAFWARGYEATTMADLVAVTGINRGSIYSAFTDKRGLFRRALDHYDTKYRSDFLDHLARRHPPREAIIRAFALAADIREDSKDARPPGCLMVNTALELSPHDPEIAVAVRASLDGLKEFFAERMRAAVAADELRPDFAVGETVGRLFGLFMGLRVMARAGMPRADRETIVKQAEEMLG